MQKITDLQNLCEKLTQDTASKKPVIAVCGLMNAGKSYLLNMLTQHFEQEYFKTADRRETTTVKMLETDHYIYLDTPGLDANAQDDAAANQGITHADIVLFVHQLPGELEKKEINFLRSLQDIFGKYSQHSIIIVISKIDKESDSPKKVENIEKAIHKQCLEMLQTTFKIFAVSNYDYKDGCHDKDSQLIDASHITDLTRHLDKMRSKVADARRSKVKAAIEQSIIEVDALMHQLHDEKVSIQRETAGKFFLFNMQMVQLQNFLSESVNNFKKI